MDKLNEKMDELDMAAVRESQRCKNCGGKSHRTDECPYKGKGMRCFRCSQFGHVGKSCETKNDLVQATGELDKGNNSETLMPVVHISNWKITFFHGKVAIKAIICLGETDTFIRKSVLSKLDCLPQRSKAPTRMAMQGTHVDTRGSYELHLTTGDDGYYLQCHVVQDEVASEELTLGKNFLKEVEITIKRGEVKVKKIQRNDDTDERYVDNDTLTPNWYDQTQEASAEVSRLLQDGRVGSYNRQGDA